LPAIVFVDAQVLENANAAFASQNNTIYISASFLSNNDSERVAATLIEEIGHSIDHQINSQDSAGDEGQIFSSLVRAETLTSTQLAGLKAENDHGVINISGQQIEIEQAGSIDYGDALSKSILFYKAQRSGDLGKLNDGKVAWRGNSALNDGKGLYPNNPNFDLAGGYYDAGDHVKFGFPMASAMTMLGWGAIQYRQAYEQSGQIEQVKNAIKWGTDYILKANVVENGETKEFWGQVGDLKLDHPVWVSPENMTMLRPAAKIDAAHPGSDLAGESAAALAAASILFRPTDVAYADDLLKNAEQLFAFANKYPGKYSDSITDVRKNPQTGENAYESSGYEDELGWGAIWLHKALNVKTPSSIDTKYLAIAQSYYPSDTRTAANKYLGTWTQTWDDKRYGSMVLLAKETADVFYRDQIEGTWLKEWTQDDRQAPTGTVKYTPEGLAWINEWGSLRYTANTAFIAGVYADTINNPSQKYSDFAKSQIEYILGKNPTGISYMVGFGNKYPERVHHRAASGTSSEGENIDNINDIIGGLVGGPTAPRDDINDTPANQNDPNDPYKDVRNGQIAYQGNEVALDYNAGFTGALARQYGINNPTPTRTRNDFNGDGKSDILWRSTSGTVALWQMNGSTVTAANLASTPSLPSSWKTAGTGDFNGDGKSDILWRNDNGSIALWQMNGTTVVSSSLTSTPNLPSSWKTAGTGDFNGDGKSDILWRNDNGSIALWQMDGSNVTSSSLTSTPSLDPSWKINGTGDFDGDGKADILWRNDNGSIALWRMNGTTVASSSLTSTPALDPSWKVAGTGDFNGDGKADILWRNDSGSAVVWEMNGAAVLFSSLTSVQSLDHASWKIAAPIF
jgi:Glycosyl hydrolase family 9/FG-GAP-like repeat